MKLFNLCKDTEAITIQFLRELDKKAYTQFIKAVETLRRADEELIKFAKTNTELDLLDDMKPDGK